MADVMWSNMTNLTQAVARSDEAAAAFVNNVTRDIEITTPKSRPSLDQTCIMYDFMIEAVVMGLLCIFGFTGNTLSIICLARDKSKTATPFLLVSLEVADTLFLVAVFLLRVATSVTRYADWEAVMPIFPYFGKYVFPCALIAETGTIYLTVLVTVNRYISVCRPYEAASLCSVQHAQKHVIVVALLSILYNLPRFFEFMIVPMWDPHRNRTVDVSMLSSFGSNRIYQILYSNILYFIVMFLVPLVSLVILNTLLIKALRRTKKKRAMMLTSSSMIQSRSEDDITLVLIVVVVVFVLCQTPALVTQLLLSLMSEKSRACPSPFFYYERISDLMVVANSSMNFLIYCFCSNKFRQILIELVCGKKESEPVKERNNMVTNATQLKVEDLDDDCNDKNGHAGTEESLL